LTGKDVVRVLVVEDDPALSEILVDELRGAGHETEAAGSVADAVRQLRSAEFDVLLLDMVLPDGRGTDVIRHVCEERLASECIVLTGYAELGTAIEAMKLGAYDYLSKPVRMDEVDQLIRKAGEKARLRTENQALRLRLERLNRTSGIVTEDASMKKLLATLDRAAASDLPVLVEGESGTGKELVARAAHERSPRFAQAFVPLNCAALPESLLESELFGHEKGAFTGAVQAKPGLFEIAHRGTLFLDEIGEIAAALQAKLLRAVELGEIQRVGATRPVRFDVRIVSATNLDLQKAVREGRFREDLYFRLNGVTLKLPPLRERPKDIALLAAHFLAAASAGRKSLSRAALRKLESYPWPGNVRELQMVIKRAAVLARSDVLEPDDLPVETASARPRVPFSAGLTLAEMEVEYVKLVLAEHQGHRGKAARALGIDAKTLYLKLGPQRPRKAQRA